MFARAFLTLITVMSVSGCAAAPPAASGATLHGNLAAVDKLALNQDAELIERMATRIGKPDDQGRVGRNRQWGVLASVRFQYGAGRALRYGVSIGDGAVASAALSAIDAGFSTVQDSGSFVVTLPEQYRHLTPSIADQASAAAFFLSDACPALIVSGQADLRRERIGRAISWLDDHTASLLEQDEAAPNRLLLNGLAFYSCGLLTESEALKAKADVFIEKALSFVRDDGVILEAGGTDTSYQAVSLSAAGDLLGLGYDGQPSSELARFAEIGTAWLSGQIEQNGRLNSSANTRTCADEQFMGKYKQADLWEVFRALAYMRVLNDLPRDTLELYGKWLRTKPNPCP